MGAGSWHTAILTLSVFPNTKNVPYKLYLLQHYRPAPSILVSQLKPSFQVPFAEGTFSPPATLDIEIKRAYASKEILDTERVICHSLLNGRAVELWKDPKFQAMMHLMPYFVRSSIHTIQSMI